MKSADNPNIHTLALAMIVKDEEDNIQNAIISAKEFVDEIIVVDTGSQDNTCKIAEKNGATVYSFAWIDSFSEARNYALSKVNSDWVLILDADEVINKFDKELLFSLNKKYAGINLEISNEIDKGKNNISHRYTRVFRNSPIIRFTGRVHEQIRSSIEDAGFLIYNSDFSIFHKGYSELDISKMQRNLKLLKLDLKDTPQDDFIKYHLGQTYFGLRKLEEAKKIFLQILNSANLTKEQNEYTTIRLTQIAIENDEIELIKKYCNISFQYIDFEGFRLFILSSLALQEGDFARAKELVFDECVAKSSFVDKVLMDKMKSIFGD